MKMMPDELNQLLRDVSRLTGQSLPAALEEDAPLFCPPPASGAGDFYLIGLIGGKDVGKSALVNALVGREITAITSHGPGTQEAVAYVHVSRENSLRVLLEREIPGRFRIVTHQQAHLERQVLVDLPDVDSFYADHMALTRRILRHLLFPLWIQSVEKYADFGPQALLTKVAAGNAPGNFIFCLNKVDQLPAASVGEIQADYGQRLARVLSLPAPPRVWAISALRGDHYELPELSRILAQQKSAAQVQTSLEQAALRRRQSALAWVDAQDLPGRAGRLRRLVDDAQETLNDRLGLPLLEGFLPQLLDDPQYHTSLLDQCLGRRLSAWPLVGALHGIFAGLGKLLRAPSLHAKLILPSAHPGLGRDLVNGQTIAQTLQTTFALLQQSHPVLSDLYHEQKYWEISPAVAAEGQLRHALSQTLDAQRQSAVAQFEPRHSPAMFLLRNLLSVGALVWFVLLQPLLLLFLQPRTANESWALRLVQAFSASQVIVALVFVVIYLSLLWYLLRWDTQRRLNRQFTQWRRLDANPSADASPNLTACAMNWLNDLTAPIRSELARYEAVAQRVDLLRAPASSPSPLYAGERAG